MVGGKVGGKNKIYQKTKSYPQDIKQKHYKIDTLKGLIFKMKVSNILTDTEIKKATPKDKKYYLNDGDGLRLKVTPTNQKIWCFRFNMNNKSYETTFKSYPTVSLKDVRTKRNEYKSLILQGINPVHHFREINQQKILDDNSNLQNIFNEWLETEKTKSGLKQWEWKKLRIQKDFIEPIGKSKNIKDIKIEDVKRVLSIKSKNAPVTADKLYPYIKGIFSYAKANDYIQVNILSDIHKNHIIGTIAPQPTNYPKITDTNILKELVNKIYNYQGHYSIKNALKLVLHIPLRAENLCNLKWSYIDFENNLLTIPRNLMKVKDKNLEDFKMPLSAAAIEILKSQYELTNHSEWVFLGNSNKSPINNESPNKALKIMGFDDVENNRKTSLHGFRGTFRSIIDTLDTDNKFSFEVKEYALDHQEKSKVVRAYTNKSDYTNQLKPLMSFWSGFIVGLLEND